MHPSLPPAFLTQKYFERLEHLAKNPHCDPRLRRRIWILLAATLGHGGSAISWRVGISRRNAVKWRTRIDREGPTCIFRERPEGRPRKLSKREVEEFTAQFQAGHSIRHIAQKTGYSLSTLARALKRQASENAASKKAATPKVSVFDRLKGVPKPGGHPGD